MESLKIEEICTGIIILVSKIGQNFLQINENQKKILTFFILLFHLNASKTRKKSIKKCKFLKHIKQKTFSSHSTDKST